MKCSESCNPSETTSVDEIYIHYPDSKCSAISSDFVDHFQWCHLSNIIQNRRSLTDKFAKTCVFKSLVNTVPTDYLAALFIVALQWRHNERDGISNHQPYDCSLNRLVKENIKAPRHWPLCGNSPVTGELSAQRASNAENISIWSRQHGDG